MTQHAGFSLKHQMIGLISTVQEFFLRQVAAAEGQHSCGNQDKGA